MIRRRSRQNSEVETGVGLVHMVLGLVATSVAVGSEFASRQYVSALWQMVAIGFTLLVLRMLVWLLDGLNLSPGTNSAFLQLADIVASVGLVILVSGSAPDAGWVLLALPIIVASLRLGAVGVLLTWAGTCVSYLIVLWFDLVAPGRESFDGSLVVERPGTLLALAAAVAVMTLWLQEGWDKQAHATRDVEERLAYVRSIELAGRRMRNANQDEIVQTCIDHMLELGFEAASVEGPVEDCLPKGDVAIIPRGETASRPDAESMEVTRWMDGSGQAVHSVAATEQRTGLLFVGWSKNDPSDLTLQSFTDLLAIAGASIELADLLSAARHEAEHDPLTGLANRKALDERLEEMAGEQGPLALLFIDVDHFKTINDVYGHQVGDDVLVSIADEIRSMAPQRAVAARFGGDEFVVALSGHTAKNATTLAQKLREARQIPLVYDDLEIEVHLSIGVGLADGPIEPSELARRADRAVYEAKDAGRNAVRTYRRSQSDAQTNQMEATSDAV